MDRDEAQRLRDAGLTLREIGERFGISHQRVHQVLHGITSKPRPRKAPPMTARLCAQCGNEFLVTHVPRSKERIYCSRLCGRRHSQQQTSEPRICETCGVVFSAPRVFHRRFCSHSCFLASPANAFNRQGDAHPRPKRRTTIKAAAAQGDEAL